MVLFIEGIHGTNANRVTSANALAGYLLAKLRYDAWTVTAGLRYEDVDLLKKTIRKKIWHGRVRYVLKLRIMRVY